MSEKPTAPIEARHSGLDGEKQEGKADVSRETQELTDAQAMLNEIMDRSMPKVSDPPEEDEEENTANSGAPIETRQEVSHETLNGEAPAPPRKNRTASVFTYLAVLFGAAFLMLLLAYFVQQRNNAAAMDDLRISTAASKEELVENIKALEEENSALKAEQEKLNEELSNQNQNLKLQTELYRNQAEELNTFARRAELYSSLDHLEQFIDAGDWLMAGVLVEILDGSYSELSPYYKERGLLPSQKARYLELRETVFNKGKCMVMESKTENPGEYIEYPHIGQDIFDEQDLYAARSLASILQFYPTSPDLVSNFICLSQTDGSIERLNGGAFKPSTAALYEQVKADMLAAGALREENGKLVADSEIPVGDPEAIILSKIPIP